MWVTDIAVAAIDLELATDKIAATLKTTHLLLLVLKDGGQLRTR